MLNNVQGQDEGINEGGSESVILGRCKGQEVDVFLGLATLFGGRVGAHDRATGGSDRDSEESGHGVKQWWSRESAINLNRISLFFSYDFIPIAYRLNRTWPCHGSFGSALKLQSRIGRPRQTITCQSERLRAPCGTTARRNHVLITWT